MSSDDKDCMVCFWFGALVMFVVFMIIIHIPSSIISKAHDAIDECEKNLPRTQHCIVSAVVDPKDTKHE